MMKKELTLHSYFDVVQSLQPETQCPACSQRDRMETLALTATLDALAENDIT